MRNINHLPDDCLIVLFEQQFALHEQIPLRAICSRWKAVIEQICSRKRSLKLFESRYFARNYTSKLRLHPIGTLNDDLIVSRLNADSSAFLVSLFPQIQQLVLHYQYNGQLEAVFYLLDQWKYSLTHLTLSANYKFNDIIMSSWAKETSRSQSFIDYVSSKLTFRKEEFVPEAKPKPRLRTQLYDKINVLPELRCLHLLTDSLFMTQDDNFIRRCNTFDIELKPNLLLQLEHLSLSSYHANLDQVLPKLGPKCTRLEINPGLFHIERWQHMLQGNLALKHSLEELLLCGYRFHDFTFIGLICDNFVNLKVLHLHLRNYMSDESDDSSYVHHFAKLRQLTDLSFHLYYPAANALLQDWPQLKTVTRVNLLLYVDQLRGGNRFNCAHFCSTLAALVPNVQTISIRTEIDKTSNEQEDRKTRDKVKNALVDGLAIYFGNLKQPVECS